MIISIYEFMEDFDNNELCEYDWEEQLKEAVSSYNQEYEASYKPEKMIEKYKAWKKNKNIIEQ